MRRLFAAGAAVTFAVATAAASMSYTPPSAAVAQTPAPVTTMPPPIDAPLPGTVVVPPYGSVSFVQQPGPGSPPYPGVAHHLLVVSQSDQEATVDYDGAMVVISVIRVGYSVDIVSGCDSPTTPTAASANCAKAPYGQVTLGKLEPPVVFTTTAQEPGSQIGAACPAGPTGPCTTVFDLAGWNLIAGPAGTVLTGVDQPLYTFQAGDVAYEAIDPGTPLQEGLGYWAYFSKPPVFSFLHPGPPVPPAITLPAGQYIMVGNPLQQAVRLSGADVAYQYDAQYGAYRSDTLLPPGTGAWVYSAAGGTLSMTIMHE